MLKIITNARIIAPDDLGIKDILIANDKILAVEDSIRLDSRHVEYINADGKYVTPGLIDQHIHITGAGGKKGFASMTPEISAEELIATGTTTVLGLLGTDGVIRSVKALYAKARSLEQQGLTAYILTGYFGLDQKTITGSVKEDMVLIDCVIGCKTAISDERSSFPTALELIRLFNEVYTGGLTSGKKGIVHIHLGALKSKMDLLFELINDYQVPVSYLSPTHCGRTKELFEHALEFAKAGGMIDISTGGTKFDAPHKQVMYALKKGVPIEQMTFSSDGNAGMSRISETTGKQELYKAPVNLNLKEVLALIKVEGLAPNEAFKLITSNPAKNLSLKTKGKIKEGFDADLCFFDEDFSLNDVISKGLILMKDRNIQLPEL